jgi:hypothetical protein
LKKIDHNIGFREKRQFFRRKLGKIAENFDHNIDPWSLEWWEHKPKPKRYQGYNFHAREFPLKKKQVMSELYHVSNLCNFHFQLDKKVFFWIIWLILKLLFLRFYLIYIHFNKDFCWMWLTIFFATYFIPRLLEAVSESMFQSSKTIN